MTQFKQDSNQLQRLLFAEVVAPTEPQFTTDIDTPRGSAGATPSQSIGAISRSAFVWRKTFLVVLAGCSIILYHPPMNREVKVHLLPALFEPDEVQGGIAIIIDVLRASTTITHALANGAAAVVPCGEVDEAKQIALRLPEGTTLLGGEREGVLIDGFHLDNNPFAYSSGQVSGKTIIFTTSNGTRALLRAARAERVLIGSFVNLQAIVDVLGKDERPVHLVCAGTKGKITVEDSLCAGAMADRLLSATGAREAAWGDDQLRLALDLYRTESREQETFRRAMRSGFGGRNCMRLGFEDQIERAGTFDLFDIVPEYDAVTKSITISNRAN